MAKRKSLPVNPASGVPSTPLSTNFEDSVFDREASDRRTLERYRKRDDNFIQHMIVTHEADKTEFATLRSKISFLEGSLRQSREEFTVLWTTRHWSKFSSVVGGFIMAFGAGIGMEPKVAWLTVASIMILGPAFFERQIDEWMLSVTKRTSAYFSFHQNENGA